MLFIHQIMTLCIDAKNFPIQKKSYNTIMISKQTKQGHYHEVSLWRPITN